jgi:hypothetical protein
MAAARLRLAAMQLKEAVVAVIDNKSNRRYFKESMNKLIPLMVRQARHERKQKGTVRHVPFGYAQESPVEGLNQRYLKNSERSSLQA